MDAPARPPQPDDEGSSREREGLSLDTIILVPSPTAPPMRCPEQAWGLLVLAVDILDEADPDREGDVVQFAGYWVPRQPADGLYDGDLVVRLTSSGGTSTPEGTTHVEMLLAHRGRWRHVGRWDGVDDRWPTLIAPTAATVMGLHCDLTEAAARWESAPPRVAPAPPREARGVGDLLDAGLLTAGDELAWFRSRGVRHTARVRADGAIVLVDGRAFASPSGAITALGGNNQNGWNTLRRLSDGQTLGDLRTELARRRTR
ncbi:hypothetical protein [Actinokineospora diospyrosa]|uniref:restriction system modified-DNA reader domain-containing protein n=1 Tax=Actinokineospora diospyrosa TaxID=103728 RepID=UPI0020A51635|nr:hypothetical protein [Actinokineospora diospyrosa]